MQDITKLLLEARETLVPIPFIQEANNLDINEAYRLQDRLIQQLCEQETDSIAGYKISMTSADTQKIAHTNEPAYGTLLQSHLFPSMKEIDIATMFTPLIEPEIMFIVQEDLHETDDVETMLEKTMVAPGIEIPDGRYEDWFPNFSLQDLIVDNTATGCIIVGNEIEPPSVEALGNIEMDLLFNGKRIDHGHSANVLENPIYAVHWLVQKLASHNKQVKKGMLISSGTFTAPIPVQFGTYKAQFKGLGSCEVTFV